MESLHEGVIPNVALPLCDWVYFAGPARGSCTVTREFVSETKAIVRNIYNTAGIRIANVQHLRLGEKILLAYGGKGEPYRSLFCCTIGVPTNPVKGQQHACDVFSYLDESLEDRLKSTGYAPDSVLHKFVGIAIDTRGHLPTLGKKSMRLTVEFAP